MPIFNISVLCSAFHANFSIFQYCFLHSVPTFQYFSTAFCIPCQLFNILVLLSANFSLPTFPMKGFNISGLWCKFHWNFSIFQYCGLSSNKIFIFPYFHWVPLKKFNISVLRSEFHWNVSIFQYCVLSSTEIFQYFSTAFWVPLKISIFQYCVLSSTEIFQYFSTAFWVPLKFFNISRLCSDYHPNFKYSRTVFCVPLQFLNISVLWSV